MRVYFLLFMLLVVSPARAQFFLDLACSELKGHTVQDEAFSIQLPLIGSAPFSDSVDLRFGRDMVKDRRAGYVLDVKLYSDGAALSGQLIGSKTARKNPVNAYGAGDRFPLDLVGRIDVYPGYRDCSARISSDDPQKKSLLSIGAQLSPMPAEFKKIAQAKTFDLAGQSIENLRKGMSETNAKVASNERAITTLRSDVAKRAPTASEGFGGGSGAEWARYTASVPLQQLQMCRIVESFKADLSAAVKAKNQIKENVAMRDREQRLTALMPTGQFQNWIVRAVSVRQASDGSAAVVFELPCQVSIGSLACGTDVKKFIGTIPESSRIYSELVRVSAGDFLGVTGNFNFVDSAKAFDKSRSVASYRSMKAGSHCDAKEVVDSDGDFFAANVEVLTVLK